MLAGAGFHFSVLKRRKMRVFFEHFIETLLIGKTDAKRDVSDLHAGVFQQFFCSIDANLEKIANRTHSGFLLECARKIAGAEEDKTRDVPE